MDDNTLKGLGVKWVGPAEDATGAIVAMGLKS